MKVKTVLIVCAILFQVLSVASIVVSSENILSTGKQVILQTAPVDPRDIFKGDYVKLDYTFSAITNQQLEKSIRQQGLKKGQKVYLSMDIQNDGTAWAKKLFIDPPEGEFYLAGYVKSHWPYQGYVKNQHKEGMSSSTKHPVYVKFGIEKYFVQQGEGLVMEEIRGTRDSFQVPMLIRVAVSDKGEALIHSFEWANIALKTEVIREAESGAEDNQASAIIRFTIMNKSEKSITLPLKQHNCSFQLIPTSGNPQSADNFAFERPECSNISTTDITLKTDEIFTVEFDLNQPQWRINFKNQPTPIGRLPFEYRYRISYEGDIIEGINVKIESSAFHGRGNID
mgnify:CR=1 FL=1